MKAKKKEIVTKKCDYFGELHDCIYLGYNEGVQYFKKQGYAFCENKKMMFQKRKVVSFLEKENPCWVINLQF